MVSLDNRRVLLVDDTPAIHEDFRKVLLPRQHAALDEDERILFGSAAPEAPVSFELDSALQGLQAIEKVHASVAAGRPYAMAFVDVRMPPGLDGVETAARLWNEDSELQVVLCTAHSDYSWTEVLRRLDVRDRLLILKKPFDPIEVYQLANALTTKWMLSRQAALKLGLLERAVEERTRELSNANLALRNEMQERERMANELRLAQKLESVGRLASGIAHEINTPIQYVGDNVTFLQSAEADLSKLRLEYRRSIGRLIANEPAQDVLPLLEQLDAAADLDFLSAEVPKAFERALEGIDRVAGLVRAMKEFAHPDGTSQVYADLNHAIESTLAVTHHEYKFNARVETQLGPLPLVNCNVGELNQVFLNLIVNAAHALAEAGRDAQTGRISITTAVAGDRVAISVADNGCGIAPENLERVFDPFFTTKPVGSGTGQGLAIVRSIVTDKHNGRIEVQSIPGRGTTFTVYLPIEGRPAAAEYQAHSAYG